jgi:pyridoxal phosphate enzyme (YggS family)
MTDNATQIAENLNMVREKINSALVSSGRSGDKVKLVVVTNGQSIQKMQALMHAGEKVLGENYPEETDKKIQELRGMEDIEKLEWHMIGHIQSRKIKYLIRYFDVIESVESIETAEKLNQRFEMAGQKVRILLEVNLSGEETKQGFVLAQKQTWQKFMDDVQKIIGMKSLELTGLMTMPPLGREAEESRPIFRLCKELQDCANQALGSRVIKDLSMGTSFDFPVAIEEGATIVRIGEAIMGPRNYA